MFCTKCGSNLPDGLKFCTNCGAQIGAAAAAMQPASAVAPEAVVPEAKPQPETVETISHVKPVVAENQPEAYVPTVKAAAPQPQPEAVVRPANTSQPVAPQPVAQPAPMKEVQPEVVAPQPVSAASAQPVNATPTQPVAPAQNMYAQPVNAYNPQPVQNGYNQQSNMQGGYGAPVQGAINPGMYGNAMPNQGSYVAPATQPVQQAQKPKKNLGKILGLAIGIPVGVLLLFIVGIVVIVTVLANKSRTVVDLPDHDPIIDVVNPVDPDIEVSDLADRTLMIYMIGSNLESPEEPGVTGGAGTADLEEILAADLPEGVNVIIECGGSYEWVNPDVPDGEVTRFKVENHELVILEELGRTTMTHEGDLLDFIEFGSTYFPAEKYDLLLWNHGGGVPIQYGVDQLDNSDESLTDAEIGEELAKSGLHFEVVIFDACNMCSLEVGKALQPCTDYMVGAESYVNGIGIYYTNWLGDLDKDVRDFSEVIIRDYMNSLDEYNLVGSMSLIRLDLIDEVYDAYVNYVNSLDYYVFSYGDFSGYTKARGNCGMYQGTDSVDLITLATKYNTDYSTPLINAVVNSVVYTESDIAFGHGLTAYSPYDYFYLYTDGRESLEKLGYDEDIITFYDKYMSVVLAYMGSDYVDAYAGSWYIHDYDVYATGGGEGVGTDAGGDEYYGGDDVYYLDIVDAGYYYGVELSDEDWDIVDTIELALLVEDDESGDYLYLGIDYTYEVDSKNRLALVDPAAWVYLNGDIVNYTGVSYYEDYDTGYWFQEGKILCEVNGYSAYLYVYYDTDHPYGAILGYSFVDLDTGIEDSTTRLLDDRDIVTILYQWLDGTTYEFYYLEGDSFYARDLELEYYDLDLDAFVTYGYYSVTTVYGSVFETDLVPLGSPRYLS